MQQYKGIPYETESTQSRGQSTSSLQPTAKTTPTLLTQHIIDPLPQSG